MSIEAQDAWLWPEGKQVRWWTAQDTAVWDGDGDSHSAAQRLRQIHQHRAKSSQSGRLRLHLSGDWSAEQQLAFVLEKAKLDSPAYAEWQIVFDAPRTAEPPVLPPHPGCVIADLWPDAERDDGQSPALFKSLLNEVPESSASTIWRGATQVERELQATDLTQRSLLVIIAHGREGSGALPFRLADGREWGLPPDIRLPPLLLLLACGDAQRHLLDYGRRLLQCAGVQTVLAPTGRLDARPTDRFLRAFLHGWHQGQRVDDLLWQAQQQPDSAYGARRLIILGRGDLHVAPAHSPAEWPDPELQPAARSLTPDRIAALRALLERLTQRCFMQDGDLEGSVDALYEALDIDYDDKEREPLLLALLSTHGSQLTPLTQSWVEPYRIYLAEIYDHRQLHQGSGSRLPNGDAPHACYHRAKWHYRQGAYPRAATELSKGLRALPPTRWHQRSGLGLLGSLVNLLIDLNLPQAAQTALDQLQRQLNRASTASADRQQLNLWDRRARLAVRRGHLSCALRHYQQKRQRDRRDPDRDLAWLLCVAAWDDALDARQYAAEVQARLNDLNTPDFVFDHGNDTRAYLLRALALWAWRSGDAAAAAEVAAWNERIRPALGEIQDPGPFAMTLAYRYLYVQDHAPVEAALPDWIEIADPLEQEHYWLELAVLSSLANRPVAESQRALQQFWELRTDTFVELVNLPKGLIKADWRALCTAREGIEQTLLLAGTLPAVVALAQAGLVVL